MEEFRARISSRTPILLALLASLLPGLASAYVLEGSAWPSGSTVTLHMGLGSPGRTLVDGNTSWDVAAVPALAAWNNVVARLDFVATSTNNPLLDQNDRMNSVVFASSVFGKSFGSSTLAVTYRTYNGGLTLETDILFNRGMPFDSYRGRLRYTSGGGAIGDIRRVFTHELGHALGLDHPDQHNQTVDAIMNSVTSNRETLAQDDISGAQRLYGAPTATPTPTPTPTPSGSSRLANISTRLNVGIGDNVMIAGFVVRGPQSKTVILRALGPTLSTQGIANPLADPALELHNNSGVVIAQNDDWGSGSQVAQLSASGFSPPNGNEAALIATLAPGSYTVTVHGYNGGTGVALAEVYDHDANNSRLNNVSTRGNVGINNDVLIGGLIVHGGSSKRIILRALGPTLASFGVNGTLRDPTLELRNTSGTVLASNDDWSTGAQTAAITSSGYQPANGTESAIISALSAGNYTAIVRGFSSSTGIALVEAYDLDP